VVEQRAVAKGRAFAAGGGLQPAADQFGALDQGHHLGQLTHGQVAQPLDRGRVIGRCAEQRPDLRQRQASPLRHVDRGQHPHGALVISALAADPHRLGQQADLLVIADLRCALAGPFGQLANTKRRRAARPGI